MVKKILICGIIFMMVVSAAFASYGDLPNITIINNSGHMVILNPSKSNKDYGKAYVNGRHGWGWSTFSGPIYLENGQTQEIQAPNTIYSDFRIIVDDGTISTSEVLLYRSIRDAQQPTDKLFSDIDQTNIISQKANKAPVGLFNQEWGIADLFNDNNPAFYVPLQLSVNEPSVQTTVIIPSQNIQGNNARTMAI